MKHKTILVVDDQENMQQVLSILFSGEGYAVLTADNGAIALDILDAHPEVDLIISDLRMPELEGMDLFRAVRLRKPFMPFILVTAYGTVENAVEAMKLGVIDFISKPFNKDHILHTVHRVWKMADLERENQALKGGRREHNLVFRSPAMESLVQSVRRVAPFPSPVLLTGESGCGKEVIARTIHRFYQGEKTLPFVSVNCPAVPESLFESELFGYKKGAFTGADADFPGRVRMAEGGTLFLDEIGDLPMAIQPKLLRLLEDKTIEPLGTGKAIPIETRIVCATNKNLEQLVGEGKFREDLLYRINTFHFELPPLRERVEDIAPLAEYFLDKFAVELGVGEKHFAPEVVSAFEHHLWPGNIRELRNVVERMVVLSPGELIKLSDLPKEIAPVSATGQRYDARATVLTEHSSLVDVERLLLEEAMEKAQGNISAAARFLGITRNTMRYRLKKYNLDLGNDH